mmetsp:Transcript_13379/g.23433  ORF Transcript_13379/g.23433 Transcript_13379/m.23433 type:complete len:188 (+) Transcript_13379:176-739(+)|eukprot:CAMPEP_0205923994 /NCGR_PEP_ID=MMETSP1325-20131115/16717_1 /ASSEMBLY_ACC=CAM_ASM_000708 /TAXON_ID=236786 /ORGANISM="Florenciella sp., Strain RCC1007" /LENGTH=187 /DNA_ID=CAMNT_0053292285 /DNA_START=105 /DNA_END=668 /DNA_ORIENTATION=-
MDEAMVPMIKAILILDGDGNRLATKYYEKAEFSTDDVQLAFEQKLYRKTKHTNARSEAEIIMLEKNVAIYRSSNETKFFVVGSATENELILTGVLDALHDTLNILLRGMTDRRTLLDSLELVILTIDEICDGGMILEMDPQSVASRALMRGVDGGQVPITELTIGQALNSARDQFIKSMGNQRDGGY